MKLGKMKWQRDKDLERLGLLEAKRASEKQPVATLDGVIRKNELKLK